MFVLVSDPFSEELISDLSSFATVSTDKADVSKADVILVRAKTKCNKEYIDTAVKCKLIIRGGVGLDNIDLEYARSKGIEVMNTPKSSSISVAELAFSFMLGTASRLCMYSNGMVEGKWLKTEKRSELYGKKLALIGMGNISKEVAKRALAFGMTVKAYDKYVSSDVIKSQMDVNMVNSLEELVEDADYISIHVPLNDETRDLVNMKLIDHMKNNPVIINTARAAVINLDDICTALKEGKVKHLCTDVYPVEPPDSSYPLLSLPNVTLTPHVGANTHEALGRIGKEIVNILKTKYSIK